MWNVLGYRYARMEEPRWGIVPYIGLGLLHSGSSDRYPLALSFGVQGQYRITKRLTALLEIGNIATFSDFDGVGDGRKFGDHLPSLSAGFSFTIGKVGWKRAVDTTPYIQQNEWLTDYANALQGENRRNAARHVRDARMVSELKKILDIEGLLDRYEEMFGDDGENLKDYPRNDYSGLNSLRARLEHRHWNGFSPLSDKDKEIMLADSLAYICNGDSTSYTDYLNLIQSGKVCLGAPVYFFFELGTSRLSNSSQLVNLDEMARVVKKYGLYVTVIGAADKSTGTTAINDSLSLSRADYIASELIKRGIPAERMDKRAEGGISKYTPDEANRHTKVMLYLK